MLWLLTTRLILFVCLFSYSLIYCISLFLFYPPFFLDICAKIDWIGDRLNKGIECWNLEQGAPLIIEQYVWSQKDDCNTRKLDSRTERLNRKNTVPN